MIMRAQKEMMTSTMTILDNMGLNCIDYDSIVAEIVCINKDETNYESLQRILSVKGDGNNYTISAVDSEVVFSKRGSIEDVKPYIMDMIVQLGIDEHMCVYQCMRGDKSNWWMYKSGMIDTSNGMYEPRLCTRSCHIYTILQAAQSTIMMGEVETRSDSLLLQYPTKHIGESDSDIIAMINTYVENVKNNSPITTGRIKL